MEKVEKSTLELRQFSFCCNNKKELLITDYGTGWIDDSVDETLFRKEETELLYQYLKDKLGK